MSHTVAAVCLIEKHPVSLRLQLNLVLVLTEKPNIASTAGLQMISRKLVNTVLIMMIIISLSGCMRDPDSSTSNQPVILFEESQTLVVDDAPASYAAEAAATVDSAVDIRYLRIKHHMVECDGFHVGHCFLVQEEGSDEWVYFYDSIDGFDYQWGHDYEILVQTQSIDYALADTSGQRYSLLEVISQSQQDTGTHFRYVSRSSEQGISEIAPGTFSLLGNIAFKCTSQSCAALRSAIAQQHNVVLSFKHPEQATDMMLLTAVTCSDSASIFAESCI